MVFSQSSLQTQNVLKLVKLDHLKTEKSDKVDGSTEVVTCADGYSNTAQSSPVATTSHTEESLKSEPLYSAMFHDSDFEFFQELDPLYYDPAKEEVAQTIDSPKQTEEKAFNIDTPHNTFSPQVWEQFVDVNSPMPQTSFYNITPHGPLSPNDNFLQFDNNMFSLTGGDNNESNFVNNQEKFLDIMSLPMVIGDLASETVTDMDSWQTTEQVKWTNTPDTHYNLNTLNTDSFINTDDSLDIKFGSLTPGKIDFGGLVCGISKEQTTEGMSVPAHSKRSEGLSVDVSVRAPVWPGDISTPVILSQVISLEKENTEILNLPDACQGSPEVYTLKTSPKVDYEPITPQSECHIGSDNDDSKSNTGKRRRHDSEDSDETYTPYSSQPSKTSKRRKPSTAVKDLIALEKALESQPKARRGRPPKRRESTVSSVCSLDDSVSSTSTSDYKYRLSRDRNNEASKRSRMKRKFKEREMEMLVVKLEETNKELRVKANILEEMTKKIKDQLMAAMLQK